MSTDVVNSPIVVGIDGSESALIAMRWAEQEAAAHGWPLRLVNAYEQLPVTPTMVAKTALEVAEESLREARKILESSSYADSKCRPLRALGTQAGCWCESPRRPAHSWSAGTVPVCSPRRCSDPRRSPAPRTPGYPWL
jgi:hypothetical protein